MKYNDGSRVCTWCGNEKGVDPDGPCPYSVNTTTAGGKDMKLQLLCTVLLLFLFPFSNSKYKPEN